MEKNNKRKVGLVLLIIIVALTLIGSLGYISYNKFTKTNNTTEKESANKTTKEQKNSEDEKETTDDTKSESAKNNNNVTTNSSSSVNSYEKNIGIYYGDITVDVENNTLKVTQRDTNNTYNVNIPGEKIVDAASYGSLGCDATQKYIILLTESGNLYINKTLSKDSNNKLEFVKITMGGINDIVNKKITSIEAIHNNGQSCGTIKLGIQVDDHMLSTDIDMNCSSNVIEGAKIVDISQTIDGVPTYNLCSVK